jgi:hypothetical protein
MRLHRGEWRNLEVAIGGRTVGILPIWERPNRGIKRFAMPPFTRTLGPAINPGNGGESTRMHCRFKITSDLLAQVPRASTFKQVLDWTTPDVLAFQGGWLYDGSSVYNLGWIANVRKTFGPA